MHRFSPRKGLVFKEFDKSWELQRVTSTGDYQFESNLGELKNISYKESLKLWHSLQWIIDLESLESAADVLYYVTPADLSAYPVKWQEIAKRRKHYIDAINPQVTRYKPDSWKVIISAAADSISDTRPPSPSAVHSWWKRYRVTKSINNLLPYQRGETPKKQSPRYTIFEEVISKAYLTTQKLPVTEIYRMICQRITLKNMSLDEQDQIKKISLPTVYRWVESLRSDVLDTARLGANVARNKHRIVMGGLQTDQILERIEIDHTPLDLIVIDTTTMLPLGKAWLTLALDKFSRMVMGFYISFNAPSAYAVLHCLKQSMLPKFEILKRFPEIKNEWPAFGIPDLIATDNGMDLHSDALKQVCIESGIQLLYCPVADPAMKGSVERFFRTLQTDLVHRLPGTTFSNVLERGDYASEKNACIDMETLVFTVTRWIVDIYNVSPHRGIKDTPLNKWTESARSRVIELPVYPHLLDVITGIPTSRTVFHYGIELEGLHYNNKQLQEIRRITGDNLKVDLKYYEDQIYFIDVFDPYQKVYLRVNAVHEDYCENMHRKMHHLAQEQARRKFGDRHSLPELMEARADIESKIQSALKDKKMANRKLAANLYMHDSVSVFESKNVLEIAHKSKRKKIDIAVEPLESGLEDDLPKVRVNAATKESKL